MYKSYSNIELTYILYYPKILLKSPKLIGQKFLSYERFVKDKRLKFTFLGRPAFQVFLRGSSPPKKT